MMAMNIKNPEAERLARELAKRTGESLTVAVTVALRERLDRQEKADKKESRMEWLNKLVQETALLLKDCPASDQVGDLLFDKETGLPI
jgi:antitoxin VapB